MSLLHLSTLLSILGLTGFAMASSRPQSNWLGTIKWFSIGRKNFILKFNIRFTFNSPQMIHLSSAEMCADRSQHAVQFSRSPIQSQATGCTNIQRPAFVFQFLFLSKKNRTITFDEYDAMQRNLPVNPLIIT